MMNAVTVVLRRELDPGQVVAFGQLRLGWKNKGRGPVSDMEREEERPACDRRMLSYCFILGAGTTEDGPSLPCPSLAP